MVELQRPDVPVIAAQRTAAASLFHEASLAPPASARDVTAAALETPIGLAVRAKLERGLPGPRTDRGCHALAARPRRRERLQPRHALRLEPVAAEPVADRCLAAAQLVRDLP